MTISEIRKTARKNARTDTMRFAADHDDELYYKYRTGYFRFHMGKMAAFFVVALTLLSVLVQIDAAANLTYIITFLIGDAPKLCIACCVATILVLYSSTGGERAFTKREGEVCVLSGDSLTLSYYGKTGKFKHEKTVSDIDTVLYQKRKGRIKVKGDKTVYIYAHYSRFNELLKELKRIAS